MARSTLEAQLDEITREFVTRVVATIRSASFAEVAGFRPLLHVRTPDRRAPRIATDHRGDHQRGRAASAAVSEPTDNAPKRRGRRPKQSPEKRAELGDRIVQVLRGASSPMGARAIASEVGLAPDLLAAPLKDLRTEGRIKKHGDKRATTYSLA